MESICGAHCDEVISYKNAKPMYYVDAVDNQDTLRDIVLDTYRGLKEKSK